MRTQKVVLDVVCFFMVVMFSKTEYGYCKKIVWREKRGGWLMDLSNILRNVFQILHFYPFSGISSQVFFFFMYKLLMINY